MNAAEILLGLVFLYIIYENSGVLRDWRQAGALRTTLALRNDRILAIDEHNTALQEALAERCDDIERLRTENENKFVDLADALAEMRDEIERLQTKNENLLAELLESDQ